MHGFILSSSFMIKTRPPASSLPQTAPAMMSSAAQRIPVSDLLAMLEHMMIIRRVEEKVSEVYTAGHIGGFCHLCIGQEAIAAATGHVMQPQDTMITGYRSHGHALISGLTPFQVVAELMGKKGGSSKGKGGSMHLFHPKGQFFGGHGIVGAQTALGTGLAWAHKYKEDQGVCLVFLGDGATNQGQFFEAMNMASLWRLPVVYIIENNGYSMGTAVARACSGGPLHQRGAPFDIAGCLVSGDHVLNLIDTMALVIERVRQGGLPEIIEIDTYRFKGHSMSDPGKYRTRTELDQARHSRDPIVILGQWLQENHGISPEDIQARDEKATAIALEALHQAQQDDQPTPASLWEDVTL
jgi:pyruvate dehydrogenase E1 component alpha subunit